MKIAILDDCQRLALTYANWDQLGAGIVAFAGALADTGDLVAGLRAGDIAGAGLDVYDEEPLLASHPLRFAPRGSRFASPAGAGRR